MLQYSFIEELLYKKIVGYDYYMRECHTNEFIASINSTENTVSLPIASEYPPCRYYIHMRDLDEIHFNYNHADKAFFSKLTPDGTIKLVRYSDANTMLFKSENEFICGLLKKKIIRSKTKLDPLMLAGCMSEDMIMEGTSYTDEESGEEYELVVDDGSEPSKESFWHYFGCRNDTWSSWAIMNDIVQTDKQILKHTQAELLLIDNFGL